MPPQQQQETLGPAMVMPPQETDEMIGVVISGNMNHSRSDCINSSDTVCAVQQPHPICTSLAEDQRMLDDLRDVVQALKVQEALYSKCTISQPLFFDSWRPVMVSWMYSVIDTFALNEICVPVALYFLDTCSHLLNQSAAQSKAKELYPLMAMTSLNLAVKCHETRMFPLDQLVQLMGGKNKSSPAPNHAAMRYTPDDVIRMEKTLLQGCLWKLHPATSIDFLHQFVMVLDESIRKNVLQRGLLHLKHASLWEHVLHQQQLQDQQQPQSFLPSTMAYASLLLAMEDLQVPLADKQACCLALLQVADLSTHTPFLSKAYNWLVYAQQLQQQLVQSNQAATSAATAPAVVSPSTPPAVQQQLTTTKPTYEQPRKIESQPNIISPAASMETSTTITNTTSMQDSVESSEQQQEEIDSDDDESSDHPEDEQDDDDDLSDSEEVIFYSHTYTGDGFEVMAVEFDDHDDVGDIGPCQRMETFSLTSPEGGTSTDLVLTESVDEDGFEFSYYSLVRGSLKAVEQLSNMLASPRDVIAA